jgi:very-short-patch-repair endonuclease
MKSDIMVKALRERTARSITTGLHNGKSKDTSLELRFERFLKLAGIGFGKQFVVTTDRGPFTFDFIIPDRNMLVEIDGEYWHRKSLEVCNRDRLKETLAESMGFIVARISDMAWEPEIIDCDPEIINRASDIILESRKSAILQRSRERPIDLDTIS